MACVVRVCMCNSIMVNIRKIYVQFLWFPYRYEKDFRFSYFSFTPVGFFFHMRFNRIFGVSWASSKRTVTLLYKRNVYMCVCSFVENRGFSSIF